MIGLLQRVSSAAVTIDGMQIAEIGRGPLVLVGFTREDQASMLERFVERILHFRVFPDGEGKMNLDLRAIDGELLLVPQFTLAADTDSGHRPSFSPAAPPERGRALFEALAERASTAWPGTSFGRFGADMQVALINDGPVTFRLELRTDHS